MKNPQVLYDYLIESPHKVQIRYYERSGYHDVILIGSASWSRRGLAFVKSNNHWHHSRFEHYNSHSMTPEERKIIDVYVSEHYTEICLKIKELIEDRYMSEIDELNEQLTQKWVDKRMFRLGFFKTFAERWEGGEMHDDESV